jgi:hypothetical protein
MDLSNSSDQDASTAEPAQKESFFPEEKDKKAVTNGSFNKREIILCVFCFRVFILNY